MGAWFLTTRLSIPTPDLLYIAIVYYLISSRRRNRCQYKHSGLWWCDKGGSHPPKLVHSFTTFLFFATSLCCAPKGERHSKPNMDRFRNLWRSIDRPPDSTNTSMTPNESPTTIPDRSSGSSNLGRSTGHQSSRSQSQSQPQSRQNTNPPQSSGLDRHGVSPYSPYSTQGPFHTRIFFSENFMLGAGVVIIQPSSGKVVIVQDGDYWFLPKGRKDLGESIEEAALREAYEEVSVPPGCLSDRILTHDRQSGYRCEFLPLYHWTNAPTIDSQLAYGQKHTEPLFVKIASYPGRRNRPPGEYLTFWYTCQIGPDAVS